MKLTCVETGSTILTQLHIAKTHWEKFKGLMMNDTLKRQEGLWIDRCRSIHTCFMKIPIDVLFVTEEGEIVLIIENMTPWKVSPVVRTARHVVECTAGTVAEEGLACGMHVRALV